MGETPFATVPPAAVAFALGTSAYRRSRPKFRFTFRSPWADRSPKSSTSLRPDFKGKPIDQGIAHLCAGSYQDTIVKALTANKAGTPPVASVLLSTDTFTLIDEDAIVPIDNFVKTPEDKAWLGGFTKPSCSTARLAAKPGRAVPALDRRALLEQGAVQGSRARPEQGAADLGRDDQHGAKAHRRRTPAAR